MPVVTDEIAFDTGPEMDIVEITGELGRCVRDSGLRSGTATVFCAGATGALTTVEYEPGLVEDLHEYFERTIPRGRDYAHNARWEAVAEVSVRSIPRCALHRRTRGGFRPRTPRGRASPSFLGTCALRRAPRSMPASTVGALLATRRPRTKSARVTSATASWGDGNGHSHVRATLLGPSLVIPFVDGRLTLGTWQQVIFVDFDLPARSRRLVVQLMGE